MRVENCSAYTRLSSAVLPRTALIGLLALTSCTIPSDDQLGPGIRPPLAELRIGSPTDTVLAITAGDIAGCGTSYKDEATAALIAKEPGAQVLALGDLAYKDGTAAEFQCYHASWGAFKQRTHPTPGNHDYNTPEAKPYFDYWNGVGADSGRAGHRARGYYAFDYGAWRIIVLNSQLNLSAQTTWLKAELAANPRQCILAMWHRPLYSSNNGSTLSPSIQKWWEALLAAKAEIVLGGSHHYYERFKPQNATSGATAAGVRQFVVGTGGGGVGTVDIVPRVNSEKLILRTHGVLLLKLFPGQYSFDFRRIDGVSLDSGVASCDGSALNPPPPPPPSAIALTVTGRQDATTQYMTLSWSGATGAMVDVYRNGALIKLTENDGHYTNTRAFQGAATYVYKLCEAGSSVCSNEATVEFGGGSAGSNTAPIASFSSSCTGLACSFTDASTDADGTVTGWSWTFGDGGSSSLRHPTQTYAAAGTYTVNLTATDNAGATGTASEQITVSNPTTISLSVAGRTEGTTQYMTLSWSGATGAMVDVYRNGALIKTTENDGHYTNTRSFQGAITYIYKVCEAGTATCSNEATVTFK
jgi:PKD repeat protein